MSSRLGSCLPTSLGHGISQFVWETSYKMVLLHRFSWMVRRVAPIDTIEIVQSGLRILDIAWKLVEFIHKQLNLCRIHPHCVKLVIM